MRSIKLEKVEEKDRTLEGPRDGRFDIELETMERTVFVQLSSLLTDAISS